MADIAALGISVDSRQAVSAAGDLDKLSRASGQAETSTQKLARSVGASEETMARYSAIATRVGVAVAAMGVAAAGALVLMVKNTLSSVDEQAKLARQLGGTIDGLRGLQIAAEDAGVDTGALASSLGRFQAVLGEAERGTGTAVGALNQLGLSAQELSALDIDERLALIIERMEGLGLSATQSADVLRQFGIRNAEVLRLVQQGADVLRASRAEVDAFGLSISSVDASAIERANDAMGRISRVVEVFATRMTVALAPALELVSNWLNELTRQNGGWRDSAEYASEAIVNGLIAVVDAYEWVNRAGQRLLLLFADTQAAAATFGITVREALGFDATEYQRELVAAAEAQRAFVEELESGESMGDALRRIYAEAQSAGAGAAPDALPLADIALGAGAVTAAAEEAAAAVEELRTQADILRDIENLRGALMTDEESTIAQRDNRLELLREGLEMEAITKQEYRDLEQAALMEFDQWQFDQLDAKYQQERALADEMAAYERSKQQERMAGFSSFFGNLATITAVGGKKVFAVTKAFQIAQGIIDAYAAAAGAYKVGASIGGPPLGAAFAAVAFGAQMARVASMQATEIGDQGASNRQAAGNVAPAPAAAAAPAQDVTVRIDSDRNLFSRADIQQIIAGISDAVGDGANLRLAGAT